MSWLHANRQINIAPVDGKGSPDDPITLILPKSMIETKGVRDQAEIFLIALCVYAEKNKQYKDNWRRMGWRGMIVRVYERADRLWDSLWDQPLSVTESEIDAMAKKLDDGFDLINFVGFLIRAATENNRDGSWPWSRRA